MSIKDELNPFGMKELSARNKKYSGEVSLNLTRKLYSRREPTRAYDEHKETPNNRAKCKIDMRRKAWVTFSAGQREALPMVTAHAG